MGVATSKPTVAKPSSAPAVPSAVSPAPAESSAVPPAESSAVPSAPPDNSKNEEKEKIIKEWSPVFKKFIEEYEKMWKTTSADFLATLLITATGTNRNFEEVIYQNIKSEYKNTQRNVWAWKYLNPNFTEDLVHANFNGSLNVCYWITNKITNQGELKQLEKVDTTYVFNWGNIPIGTMDGIQPNAEIKALIKTSQDLKKQQITDMIKFTKKL